MNQVVQFQAPRLPYHPVVQERFGVDRSSWKALVEAVFPSAETPDSVVMALAYCKARNLDVFKKPVHIVPVYDSKRRCMVETVWPGIAEIRTTATRTNVYAGCDEVEWGEEVTRDLSGVSVTFPLWGRMTVYKIVAGVRCAFVGPKVLWLETYATQKRDTDAPNAMWRKRPHGQLEKCVEAAALRKAFPEELGGVYAAEEMEGRVVGADGSPLATSQVVTPRGEAPKLHADFDEPAELAQDAEFTDASSGGAGDDVPPGAGEASAADTHPDDQPATPEAWAVEVNRSLDDFKSVADLDAWMGDQGNIDRFNALQASSPSLAKSLDAALTGRKKALAHRERDQ